jgi:hypothetical protein
MEVSLAVNRIFRWLVGMIVLIFRGSENQKRFTDATDKVFMDFKAECERRSQTVALADRRAQELVRLYESLGQSGTVPADLIRGKATRIYNQRGCTELFHRSLGIKLDEELSGQLSRYPDPIAALRAVLAAAGCDRAVSATEPTLQTVRQVIARGFPFSPPDAFSQTNKDRQVIHAQKQADRSWNQVKDKQVEARKQRATATAQVERLHIAAEGLSLISEPAKKE